MTQTIRPTKMVTFTSCLALAVAACAAVLYAGPLNPPAGPVAPTYKTLVEVEPRIAINATNTPGDADSLFKITQPGSYYLTGNVTGVVGRHGIEIASNSVTLDLRGFDVAGVPGSLSGVACPTGAGVLRGVTVRSGTVRGWGQSGIDLAGAAGNVVVEDIHALSNGLYGIAAAVPGVILRGCTSYQNIEKGVLVGDNAVVESCVFASNGTGGIMGGNGVVVRSSAFRSNFGFAVDLVNSANVSDCTVESGANGIHAVDRALITGCSVSGTTGTGGGIQVQNSSTVSHNTCTNNTGGGIIGSTSNLITDNLCVANTNAGGTVSGIRVSSLCRVDGNAVNQNSRGISTTASGSLIVRNTAGANTINFDLTAGTKFGPLITGAGGSASGSSAASVLGTTDPWANFSL